MWHRRSYVAIHGSGLRNTLLRSRHDSCRHDLAGTHLLDALDDDLLSLLEAVGDHDVAALLGAGRYAALLDFLVRPDNENIAAGLIEEDGGLRNRQRRFRRPTLHGDADNPAREQH